MVYSWHHTPRLLSLAIRQLRHWCRSWVLLCVSQMKKINSHQNAVWGPIYSQWCNNPFLSDPQATLPTQPLQILVGIANMNREQADAQQEQLDKLRETGGLADTGPGVTGQGRCVTAHPSPVALHRMGEGHNPQVFLEAFQPTAETCQWPPVEWVPRLLPSLLWEAQTGVWVFHQNHRGTSQTSAGPCLTNWASPRKIIDGSLQPHGRTSGTW